MKVIKRDKYVYVKTKGGSEYQLKEDKDGLHIYRTDLGGDIFSIQPMASNHIHLRDGKTNKKWRKKSKQNSEAGK